MELSELEKLAEQIGFSHIGPVNMDALQPSPEVRKMCASGRCQMYGHSWSCPPGCGTVEEMAAKLRQYEEGLLVQTTGQMEDDFDLDTIRSAEQLHRSRFETLARQARLLEPDCMPMSAGTCTRCKKCTYPDRPCRFPSRVFPSMEACGLLVGDVCTRSGLAYNYGPKTITYTACVLIHHTDAGREQRERIQAHDTQ